MGSGFLIYDKNNAYAVDVDDILIRRDVFAQGTLAVWGNNDSGQVGDGTHNTRLGPFTIPSHNFTAVVCGPSTTAAIDTTGALWVWGYGNGQSVPTQYPPILWKKIYCDASPNNGTPNDYFYGTDVNEVFYNIPFGGSLPIVRGISGYTWKNLINFNDANHGLGIQSDGTLWRLYWQSIIQIGSANDWRFVSSSSLNANVVLLKNNNTLWFMDCVNTSSPYYLNPSPIFPAIVWSSIVCHMQYIIGIKIDGSLWFINFDNNGGYMSPNSTIAQIGSSYAWKQVAVDTSFQTSTNYNICAVKVDGTLWAKGDNASGQCGHDSTNPITEMTQIGFDGNWRYVSGGDKRFAAIKDRSL